ncbi:MAG: T9SS type A sorting domain-containing protein [Bacteroidales bacterium]|nr:T9SS type A sorting domain-containing protein [Bacteroidales bacterium]
MKRFACLASVSLLFVMSVGAQSYQMPVEKVLRLLMPNRMEKQVVLQKGYTDSLLYEFTVQDKEGDVVKVYDYQLEQSSEFALDGISYTYTKNGQVLETGSLEPNGDTLSKTVYTYLTSNNTVIRTNYEYEDADPVVSSIETFYGVKNIEIPGLDEANGIIDMAIMICDSFTILQFEAYQEMVDTTTMNGFFTFTDGLPTKMTIGMDYAGMLMDVIINMVYTGKVVTDMRVIISAMGGMMTAPIMNLHAAYNADDMLTLMELIPQKNDLIDASAFIGGRQKIEYSYQMKKPHCASQYGWVEYDSTHADYELNGRIYYTYDVTTGEQDTVYFYSNYKQEAGVRNASRLAVTLSPNPVKDMLQVSGLEQPAQVAFFNTEGKKVMESRVEAGTSYLSLQSLPQGVYFMAIRNEEGVTVQKIVKQ